MLGGALKLFLGGRLQFSHSSPEGQYGCIYS